MLAARHGQGSCPLVIAEGPTMVFSAPRGNTLPGQHITDHQMRLYMTYRKTKSTSVAAAKASFSAATGYRLSQSSVYHRRDARLHLLQRHSGNDVPDAELARLAERVQRAIGLGDNIRCLLSRMPAMVATPVPTAVIMLVMPSLRMPMPTGLTPPLMMVKMVNTGSVFAASSSRRRCAPRASRSVPRPCRLRRAPSDAVVPAFVRALLRSIPALVSTPVSRLPSMTPAVPSARRRSQLRQ